MKVSWWTTAWETATVWGSDPKMDSLSVGSAVAGTAAASSSNTYSDPKKCWYHFYTSKESSISPSIIIQIQ